MATEMETRPTRTVPPLRAGDRLSRGDFKRRYEAMPEIKKAELIEGVVYMPSPVSTESHGAPQFSFVTWLGVDESQTPGVQGADNATLRLDWDNEPQPDAFLRILPPHGGQTRDEGGFVTGGPEWVGKIALEFGIPACFASATRVSPWATRAARIRAPIPLVAG